MIHNDTLECDNLVMSKGVPKWGALFYFREVMQLNCNLYDPIDKKEKANCINCHRWGGKKCKDEALLLANEQRRYGATDRAMRQNRGVWL